MWGWMTPYLPSRSTSTVMATPKRTAVSNSCEFIRPTITAYRYHAPFGQDQLGGSAPGSAMPHGGEAVGDDAGVGALRREHARYPGFVRAHVAYQYVLVSHGAAQVSDDALRLERVGFR